MNDENFRRSVLITGGASGIGAEIATSLAEHGYRVVVADLNLEKSSTRASLLPGAGHSGLSLDVSNPHSVEAALEEAERRVGPITDLVHAAGIMSTQKDGGHLRFWESGVIRWDQTMTVNARGTYIVASEFVKRRVANPVSNGRIVLFASAAGQSSTTPRTYADYAASKAAVLGFLRPAARDCAPLGITVNAVAPGIIETPMLRKNIASGSPVDPALVPVGRVGEPAEVAALVKFILSKEAAFITGATFDINGGQLMR